MPDLPLKNKSALITQLTEGKLSPAYVQHFAKVRSLTPAILSRTIRVAKELNTSNFAETLLMMFNQTLKSQNKPKIEPLVLGKADYNLDYVACNDNIHRISEGLKRSKKRANLLLWSARNRKNRLGSVACRGVRYAFIAKTRL